MFSTAFLYFMAAAYLAGIGSAVGVFGLFLRAADGKHPTAGCFMRATTSLCFVLACYLAFEGWMLLA